MKECTEEELTLAGKYTVILHTNPYDKTMEHMVRYVEPGYCEMTLQTRPEKHGNASGGVHGGAIVGFSDTALGLACFSVGKRVNTIDINGNFLKPIKMGTKLIAKSRVLHNGRTTVVAEVHIYDESDRMLYAGRGTFFVRGPFDIDM